MTNQEVCRSFSHGEEYRDYIVQYVPSLGLGESISDDVCVRRIGAGWMIYTDRGTGQVTLANKGYFVIPKLYYPMDALSLEESGISRIHRQQYLNLTGEGVIVGMVDSGIDIYNQAFRDSAGFTRIGTLWDQTDDGGETPQNFYYGSVYDSSALNEFIEQNPQPQDYVPGQDESGHGTFLMGVAAGSRIGEEYLGAAYYSEIAVVKLRQAKEYLRRLYYAEGEEVYAESDIMQGIQYLIEYASARQKPLVIMLGLGSMLGAHSGQSPLESYLNEIGNQPGRVVCVCSGNVADAGLHYYGRRSDREFDVVELQVEGESAGFVMELWSRRSGVFAVGLVSPGGEEVDEVPAKLNMRSIASFVFEPATVTIDYKIVEIISGKEVVIMSFDRPTQGIWQLRIYGGGPGDEYDLWLSGSARPNVRFITPSANTTLTGPSGAEDVITVGAYNQVDGSLYASSGRGFTANQQIKPDMVAPGVNVSGVAVGGGYTRRSGTSVANAHVAGACALLLEWGIVRQNAPIMNTDYAKTILIRGTRKKPYIDYPSPEWGWGELNLYGAFESFI